MADLLDYQPAPGLLAGRVILITGASSGIGRAVAVAAGSLGAELLLQGRKRSALREVSEQITAQGGPEPGLVLMDFKTAQGPEYQALVEHVESRFGRLDGLLHNAAILGELTPIEHYDIARWQEVIHVNLNSTFILTRCLLPLLKSSQDGSIIFTTSTVGHEGRAYWGAYAASKFGVEGLFQILAQELRERPDLRVNCINPGATRTQMRHQAFPAEDPNSLKTPDDIVGPYLYLLGPDSRGISGQLFEPQKP